MAENPVVRIVVLGAAGRMGAAVVNNIGNRKNAALAGTVDRNVSGCIRAPEDLPELLKKADAAIDFTSPSASAEFAGICAGMKKPVVIGATGFDETLIKRIKEFAGTIPILLSPNMSPAVNLTFVISRLIAEKLPYFDIHISETHHKAKKDAPSGTALKYLEHLKKAGRGNIGVTSARAGDITGEHTILYAGPYERIELTHRAHSRDVFAEGAVNAALWLVRQKPGLYDYLDVLGLKNFAQNK